MSQALTPRHRAEMGTPTNQAAFRDCVVHRQGFTHGPLKSLRVEIPQAASRGLNQTVQVVYLDGVVGKAHPWILEPMDPAHLMLGFWPGAWPHRRRRPAGSPEKCRRGGSIGAGVHRTPRPVIPGRPIAGRRRAVRTPGYGIECVYVPLAFVEGPLLAPCTPNHRLSPACSQYLPRDVELRLVRHVHVHRNRYGIRVVPPVSGSATTKPPPAMWLGYQEASCMKTASLGISRKVMPLGTCSRAHCMFLGHGGRIPGPRNREGQPALRVQAQSW